MDRVLDAKLNHDIPWPQSELAFTLTLTSLPVPNCPKIQFLPSIFHLATHKSQTTEFLIAQLGQSGSPEESCSSKFPFQNVGGPWGLGNLQRTRLFCGLPKICASRHFERALSSMNNGDFCLFPGDVPPISMSPISQSQFIPLGEVLLLAISAMNSAHKSVTQETLTEHLQTCFPGNINLLSHSSFLYTGEYIWICCI